MRASNPIIPGFNADPSIVRVGEDYYLATSTFEYFPGVCIHHSKDLVNWEIADYALKNDEDMDLTGVDTACGIWAPNLTYDNGLFYLAYTIVYTNRSRYKDTYNFLVTAPSVHGPWSKPIPLNRSGFDPSIFHDDDGKKYVVNQVIDYRIDRERFPGIDVQEFDPVSGKLLGSPVRVFKGSKRGVTEGPNMMKHNGWYYLFCAAGGTEFGHCEVVVRSKSLWGPFEETDNSLLITSVGSDCRLKRAGHAQVVETPDGDWVMAHLCGRPIDGEYSFLGRETALQNVVWTEDGWIRLRDSDRSPLDTYEVACEIPEVRDRSQTVDFSQTSEIPLDYMTLRRSAKRNGISIQDGKLRIEGGCSLASKFHQALLARRVQAFDCDFVTEMQFAPRHLNHTAGVQLYYNYDNYMQLKLTRDEEGPVLHVSAMDNRSQTDGEWIHLPEGTEKVTLRVQIRTPEVRFFYTTEQVEPADWKAASWKQIDGVFDARHISDEYIHGNGFTGAMVGVSCQDLQGDGVHADYSWFVYEECCGEQ